MFATIKILFNFTKVKRLANLGSSLASKTFWKLP